MTPAVPSQAESPEKDGPAPDSLAELLFLLTLFAIFAWVAAAWVFVL